jgi:hypothetical protein
MLAKGNTAIEGLSGNGRAGACAGGMDVVVLGGRRERGGAVRNECDHGADERQSRKREHAAAPVLSRRPLRRLGGCASGGPALRHYP